MFVSSYNTYIQADNSIKDQRQRIEKTQNSSKSFSEDLHSLEQKPQSFKNTALPFDYIARSQTYNNKQEVEAQTKELENPAESSAEETKTTLKKLKMQSTLSNAKSAYTDASTFHSIYKRQTSTLDQTPKIDQYIPEEAKAAKELTMRHTMVNTYLSNDRYHQITA